MGIRTQSRSISLRAATRRTFGHAPRGTRLRDRFELLVPIGSGGFGTVWEGFDMLLERPVAIKEIPVRGRLADELGDQELSDVSDALREARATARLNHPTIVSLYEIVTDEDRIYMINELVHGSTLAELIDERMMSDHDIGKIGYALCEALAHAHAQGVIHRDVKPANVMITDEWIDGVSGWRAQPAKLMDFGIASIVDSGERGRGPHAGSRGYVAPEQEAGDEATPASDVYSLALVLFECFTGGGPGRGRHARLARVRSDLPIELADCIDRCLEFNPALRPGVSELAAQLSASLAYLSEDLPDPRRFGRLRGRLFGRRRRATTATGHRDRAPIYEENYSRESSGSLWRAGLGMLAAAICLVTMLAANIPLAPIPPLIAGGLVFVLPRAGWSLAAVAGAVALAAEGQVGSAMFIVLPAIVAAFAAMVPMPRVLDGALAGAGAFAWVVAVQAMSGASLALSLPPNVGTPEEIRQYADVAAQAMKQFAEPAYTASLGLWALSGAVAVILNARRASLPVWAAAAAVAFGAQIFVGQSFDQSVPPLTLIAVPLAVVSVLLAAAAARRVGRVFTQPFSGPFSGPFTGPSSGPHDRPGGADRTRDHVRV
jgi:tRNA A-37 threonylcarbamoyl transferase component Bud32